jgi:SAM-dependent methyltransferase
MPKRPFSWDREYKTAEHLALSANPAEDLTKFTRWLERNFGHSVLNPLATVLDLGCGNGRNLIHLAKTFECRGTGYDKSGEAIKQAKQAGHGLPLTWEVRSIEKFPLPLPDQSQTMVLDMMTSHLLRQADREKLRTEILRLLKPDGWLFFKSFLAEGDLNVNRLLRDYPADEPGAYIHPKFGAYEYVWTMDGLHKFFEPHFYIHKIDKSHKHMIHGHAGKRRTVTLYLQKQDVEI